MSWRAGANGAGGTCPAPETFFGLAPETGRQPLTVKAGSPFLHYIDRISSQLPMCYL